MSSTGKDSGRGDLVASLPDAAGDAREQPVRGPHQPAGPPAVLCDFDDTTAVENVAELLLDHFSDGAWRELRKRSQEKAITFREYQELAFQASGATREAMSALVRDRATLRPYFRELWQYCAGRGIPLAVVTVGLDFYVDALLQREGLADVPRYAVETSFTSEGMAFRYDYQWNGTGASTAEECLPWGNCKCRVLAEYRSKGHALFYAGDGRSDRCPAAMADRVFARGQLAGLLDESRRAYTPFEDFTAVIRELEALEDQSEPRTGR